MRALPTLRQLRYLVAIAEHRHFGRAAEACFATQSTLSAGLQELEHLLDVKLVERSKRRVMLTPLGEQVVGRARVVLREAEDIAELASASKDPLSGPLRLGVIPTIGPYLLPRVLPPLREKYPGLRLYLREDMTARLLDARAHRSNTTRPPVIVMSTGASSTAAGSSSTSWPSTTTSASRPGASVPFSCSARSAKADPRV